MDMRRGIGLLLLLAAGCAPEPSPVATPTPTPTPAPSVPASELKAVLPKPPAGFTAKVFKERPGLVSVHLRKGDDLVGTFVVLDRNRERGVSADAFAGSKEVTVRGYPAVSTSMGGGVAVLVEDRFQVEAVSIGPTLTAAVRDRWLAATDFDRLKALAK